MKIPNPFDVELNTDFDFTQLDEFKDGVKTIETYLQEVAKDASIGHLARTFPHLQRYLLDILETLKEKGGVKYDEYRPRPTIIHV